MSETDGHRIDDGSHPALLLSTLSHDLRSPLATIASIARTLEAHGSRLDEATRADLLRRVAEKAERLGRLVSELLDLTRLEDGRIVLERAPIPVDELVRRVVTEVDEDHRVQCELEPQVASVDPMMTARIVTNLVKNALEHAGPEAAVWVRLRPQNGGVELVVEDDGDGIPVVARPGLFAPFHSSTSSTGSGYGLSAVARFVALMGGHVEVTDRDGGGARFRVWLPDPGPIDTAPTVVRLPDEAPSVSAS